MGGWIEVHGWFHKTAPELPDDTWHHGQHVSSCARRSLAAHRNRLLRLGRDRHLWCDCARHDPLRRTGKSVSNFFPRVVVGGDYRPEIHRVILFATGRPNGLKTNHSSSSKALENTFVRVQ